MNIHQLALAGVLSGFAAASFAASITVQNKCGHPVAYKVERKGSTLNTQLSPRSSTSQSVDTGDRIKLGNSTLHTVSSSSNGQTVVICTP